MVLLTQVGRRDCWEPPTGSVRWCNLTRVDPGPHSQHACKYVCGTLSFTTGGGCTASPCRVRPTQCWEQWSAVCACMLRHCAECTPCLAAATAGGFSSVVFVCYTVSSVLQLLSRQRRFPSMQAAAACSCVQAQLPNLQTGTHQQHAPGIIKSTVYVQYVAALRMSLLVPPSKMFG
jgi:hypothetical protein